MDDFFSGLEFRYHSISGATVLGNVTKIGQLWIWNLNHVICAIRIKTIESIVLDVRFLGDYQNLDRLL